MVDVLFDPTTGVAGLVVWLGAASEGWFFVMPLVALFLISFIPSMIKWGTDWPLLASSFILLSEPFLVHISSFKSVIFSRYSSLICIKKIACVKGT